MRRIVRALYVSAFLLALASPVFLFSHDDLGVLVRLPDETPVPLERLGTELSGARIVFVGESHDNRHHHAAQLEVVRSLIRSGAKVAVGLEMVRAEDQEALDRWVAGEIPEDEFVLIFGRNWGERSWPSYRGIFLYAREHGVPMIGLNVERRVVRQVSKSGFASLDKNDVPGVKSVGCDPDPKYEALIRRAMEGHHNARHRDFVRFCEAQLLWDAAMAWRLVDFVEANPDRTVVVLAGSAHSWKHGIPERVRRQSSIPFKVILPEEKEDALGHRLTKEETDYVWRFGA
jgi:uncharacterized iron-regulated protein